MVKADQITVGTKIQASGIVLEITEINEKKKFAKGVQEYKG